MPGRSLTPDSLIRYHLHAENSILMGSFLMTPKLHNTFDATSTEATNSMNQGEIDIT